MRFTRRARLAALGVATALTFGGCSATDDGPDGGEGGPSRSPGPTLGGDWILGTTDPVTAVDPAGASDIGSANLQYAAFEQLLRFEPGSTTPVGDAAENCQRTDPLTVICVMRRGNSFSNGHALTSSDVRFSFERILGINAANGPARLLDALAEDPEAGHQGLAEGAIQTPDESTVVFHLNREGDDFITLLATAAASVVDEELFPADKLLADGEVVGSGPLALRSFAPGLQATFEANPSYSGTRPARAAHAYVQYYPDSAALRSALEHGEVDVAWHTLAEPDVAALASDPALKVYRGATASGVPLLPAWEGENTAVAASDVKGVAETLDSAGVFRLWAVSK